MVLCTLSSCASRGNAELLEAQLRAQESMLAKYQREVSSIRSELSVAQKETNLLRTELAETQNRQLYEETSKNLAAVEGLKFHTMLTGGQDHDEQSGAERLHAMVFPHDQHGNVVKLSGRIEFEALDLSKSGDDRTIGHWVYPANEATELWHAGFLGSGFKVNEPWQRTPSGSKVLLLAKLTTPDGRKFETTHTITIDTPALSKVDAPELELISPPRSTVQSESKTDASTPTAKRAPRPKPLAAAILPVSASVIVPDDRVELKTMEDESVGVARPFPNVIQTSDNWTEATIPMVR